MTLNRITNNLNDHYKYDYYIIYLDVVDVISNVARLNAYSSDRVK